jgi:SAM-dependent methyltransferase
MDSKKREGYVLGTSGRNKDVRYNRAEKIIHILEQNGGLRGKKVLEVGTGAGYIAHALSKHARSVDSVDIVDDRKIKTGYKQKIVSNESLPYKDEQFDIVITNHVLEHVPDQEKHFSEMARVLKKGGIIYLASPNKWWLTDPHYKLPFISWLPRPIAGQYLNIARGRKWDIYSVSLGRLHKLAKTHGFTVDDKSWDVLVNAENYNIKVPKTISKIAQKTPGQLSRILLFVIPTHLKILRKG